MDKRHFLGAALLTGAAPAFASQPAARAAGPTAGPTSGPVAGPTSGPVAGPTSGPVAGPTSGPVAGPTSGPVAGPTSGPVLLTITGAITRSNRGALDPALDQMMAKQKLAFDRAYVLDFAALAALPARTIRPTLEYDGKPHTLRGPLLADVLAQAGARPRDAAKVLMRAVDGYAAVLEMRQLRAWNFIVATHLDGKPIPLGGLGPLWAVYDADRVPEMAALPVAQRFGACPWALYHLEVMA